MLIGKKNFDIENHTYVMGILNVTPDSFSDGGKYNSKDQALYHTEEMIKDGAAIIDVGGESTRPGYTLLSDQEEIERVVPIIETIKAEFDIPVSVDTYKSEVAKQSIIGGADLINDIWGLKYDSKMADIIANSDVACCLMHNRNNTDYTDLIPDIIIDLKETLKIAQNAGIKSDRIILDPGVGFAKSYEDNLKVINNLKEFNIINYPYLLGTSRKSVIGLTLDVPASERMEGTVVTTVMAVQAGWAFVRVHDVKSNYMAIKMAEAILNS